MEITIDGGLYLYSAILTYIVTGLSCAFIRWRHVCQPYREDPDYYFPNRRGMLVTYGFSILLTGCLLLPNNHETIIAARCWLLLLTSYIMTTGAVRHCSMHKLSRLSLLATIPIGLAVILCVISWFGTGILERNSKIILSLTAIIGLLFTIMALHSLFWLKNMMRRFYENKYSNEENFPINYAKEIIPRLLALMPAIWLTFISESPWVMGTAYILISGFHLISLAYILDCHMPMAKKEYGSGEKGLRC